MVSTRSSARKPPNPSRPLSTTSVATPVIDDPPPPYPRRSPRIRIKNGEHVPVQFISLTPPVANVPNTQQSRKPLSHDLEDTHIAQEVVSPVEAKITANINDEAPQEVTASDAKQVYERGHAERIAGIAIQTTIKKKRRRRRRKIINTGCHPSDKQTCHTNQLHNTYSDASTAERLSTDAILTAKTAVQDARSRKVAAMETALLKRQVNRLGNLKGPKLVGDVEVTLTQAHNRDKNVKMEGRKSATSFLASSIRRGPKRIPASRVAMIAASIKSLRA